MKKVYTCFCTDVIHEGHLNIIRTAKKYGEVIVGVLSDAAMIRYNRFPTISFEERMEMVRKIDDVSEVVVQNEIMYDCIIEKVRPDYVIHGDNWLDGPMKAIRDNVEKLLSQYGGEIIDVPYTYNENVKSIDKKIVEKLSIQMCPIVKTIEVHSGLTGLIAEKTVVENEDGLDQFDAMWISSLCDSTAKGKPDIELVDMTSRFRTIDDVMEVTTKPIIFDGDTGGLIEHFVYTVRTLERMGEHFCEKIKAGKEVMLTEDFMIIARIESLILEQGMEDALNRARAYVAAGADGIMIHSRKKDPTEILTFCDEFRKEDKHTPIVVVPTSFNSVTEAELAEHGVNIVIYANQLTRRAFPAMEQTAKYILKYHRAKEVDSRI